MHILFDYQAFEVQKMGGVSHVFAKYISEFDNHCTYDIGIKYSDNIHLIESNLVSEIKPIKKVNWGPLNNKRFPGRRTIINWLTGNHPNQRYSIELLKQNKYDVFVPTFFNDYFLPYLKGKPFVLTIHDMIPEKFPQFFLENDIQIRMKKKLCPLASIIQVPSESTKNDVVDILNINPDQIKVVPWGVDLQPIFTQQKPYAFSYILFVGSRFGYKNFIPFFESYRLINRTFPHIHLVCTGHNFTANEQFLIQKYELEAMIHHVRAHNQQEMNALYKNAIAFIFPSSYEGFGLPIYEAMACDCPVLVNDIQCFREIAKDAALYFFIDDKTSSLPETFEKFMNLTSIEKELIINKGKAIVKQHSWLNTATQMIDLFKTISNH